MNRLMNTDDLHKFLRKYDLSMGKVCAAIQNATGAVLKPNDFWHRLNRYGRLTETQTALLRYVEKDFEKCLKS